jgi:hypothetical protein
VSLVSLIITVKEHPKNRFIIILKDINIILLALSLILVYAGSINS